MPEYEIYYADDDFDDVYIFREAVTVLQAKNNIQASLHIFHTGDALLDNLKKNIPKNGIIFLDIEIPKKNGFAVLTEIRSNPDLAAIPVIMYANSADTAPALKSKSLGANLYVVKPGSFNELTAMIIKTLGINWDEFKAGNDNFVIGSMLK